MSTVLRLSFIASKLVKSPYVFKNVGRSNPLVLRRSSNLIPRDQYDSPWSRRMVFSTVIKNNWEVIPLFAVTGVSLALLAGAILWAIRHKVDVVFKTHSTNCISRTMNLNYPTYHKFIIINQKYEPWPKMQKVLDQIKKEERELEKLKDKCENVSYAHQALPTNHD